ncbi:MAG: hypothetical protein M1832_006026 [Thelocarpon impressellum]|nr:MAG: hypothetical protein M1832_006026 [Thelocarpon impressellum]
MLRPFFRRGPGRLRYLRAASVIAAICLAIDFLSIYRVASLSRARQADDGAAKATFKERIFVASTHWNSEAILRSHWNDAVVELVRRVGVDNIFVSVFESGSWDDSQGALIQLDQRLGELGARRNISHDATTHADQLASSADAPGWVNTPRGRRELRRIPFLAGLRNRALEPLWRLAEEGITFDKILVLNDVVFTADDVRRLLHTRGGEFAAACSLDFSVPPAYYDTFAVRDSDGDKTLTQTFPYFSSAVSRKAMLAGEPVPVQSCWNGIVVFDASPFYGAISGERLQFRGISDSLATYHLEGSECCLIHYDNPLTRTKGVFVNPHVRVAYTAAAYDVVHTPGGELWPPLMARYWGVWSNRLRRTHGTYRAKLERLTVRGRMATWAEEEREKTDASSTPLEEPGAACLVNEMQVLAGNGWMHV